MRTETAAQLAQGHELEKAAGMLLSVQTMHSGKFWGRSSAEATLGRDPWSP